MSAQRVGFKGRFRRRFADRTGNAHTSQGCILREVTSALPGCMYCAAPLATGMLLCHSNATHLTLLS